MQILNPKNVDYSNLDKSTQNILKSTISFFENKGKKKLKADDHAFVWYEDFLAHLKKESPGPCNYQGPTVEDKYYKIKKEVKNIEKKKMINMF